MRTKHILTRLLYVSDLGAPGVHRAGGVPGPAPGAGGGGALGPGAASGQPAPRHRPDTCVVGGDLLAPCAAPA
eukprot:6173663-Pyramimonas_sp.AAC.1